MIVKNEENHLATALDSVAGIDEIVVCDTGSEDNTVEVAKRYTSFVYDDFKWIDDFAAARNHSLSKCTGDWILIVDADERLMTPIAELKKAIEEAESKGFKTVSCRVISERGNQEHRQPRLFKKCPEVFWQGRIHNHLSVAEGLEADVVIRYGYSDAHQKDPDRALRILTKVVEDADTITVQIASIPDREDMLRQVVESLRPQVDKLFVALNGYDHTPAFLKEGEFIHLDNSMGDAAKFYGVENLKGYIFCCDDDLVYPANYIQSMIEGMKKHQSIVTLHGYTYPEPYVSHKNRLKTHHCLFDVLEDVPVNVGGTGAMGFHSSILKVSFSDFTLPNMADVFVAKLAREQGVKITVLKHAKDYLKYLNPKETIWEQHKQADFAQETEIEKEIFSKPMVTVPVKITEVSREKYYLAREYWYRRDYAKALKWYNEYFKVSKFIAERADGYLMAARCLWAMRQGEAARKYCLQAIMLNPNFKEALLFMATLSWEKQAVKWRQFAELADNSDVLFIR